MITVYTNTCPSWHDTRKISKDKWNQNLRGEGAQGTAGGRVVFSQPTLTFHDTKATILQKLNQSYCESAPAPPPCPAAPVLTALSVDTFEACGATADYPYIHFFYGATEGSTKTEYQVTLMDGGGCATTAVESLPIGSWVAAKLGTEITVPEDCEFSNALET